jgi:hypothetical protein
MNFEITFLPEVVEGSEVGNTGRLGEIVLGDYRELFISLIGFWSPRDYEDQWREGIKRVVQREKSCLVTSVDDPAESEVITWWRLYPVGRTVYVRNSLLLLEDLPDAFSTRDPYASILDRHTVDDGHQISEWEVGLDDFRAAFHAMDTRNL